MYHSVVQGDLKEVRHVHSRRCKVSPLAALTARRDRFRRRDCDAAGTPEPLASIYSGAMAIDREGRPDLSRFQARDGTWLAYRLYPAANGAKDSLAILAHGSSASSEEMNAVAKALAQGGVAAVAIDARGHGASGTRGDIAYIGQLDDDLADLVAELRKSYPPLRLTLIGHSSGGGFVLRIAGGPLVRKFDRFVLLAPFLGYFAPTNLPNEGDASGPRSTFRELSRSPLLKQARRCRPQSLPVIASPTRRRRLCS